MTPFGWYLEMLRRSRNLQQKQLAAMLDIDPTYVSLMERGKKGPPSQALLNMLIEQLVLDTAEQAQLWEYVEQSRRNLSLPENMAFEEYAMVRRLWQKLGSLSLDQIEIIDKILKMPDEQSTLRSMTGRQLRTQTM